MCFTAFIIIALSFMNQHNFFPIAYCVNKRQGIFACASKGCRQQGIICIDPICPCQKQHRKCTLVKISTLIQKMYKNKRKMTQNQRRSFDLIQKKIEEMIEQLSRMKQKFNITKQVFGLQQRSVLLHSYLTNQDLGDITGNTIFQVCKQVRSDDALQIASPQTSMFILSKRQKQLNKIVTSISQLFSNFTIFKEINKEYSCVDQANQKYFNSYRYPYRQQLPSVQEIIEISKLPQLNSIDVFEIDQQSAAQIVSNVKSLSNLLLGPYKAATNFYRLEKGLIQQILRLTQLRSLTLVCIQGDSQTIIKVIQNNKSLKSMRFSYCGPFLLNDSVVQSISKHLQLQNLTVRKNRAITCKHFQKMKYLKVLWLQHCKQLDGTELMLGLSNMKQITHLFLYSNKVRNVPIDQIMEVIGQCHQLRLLNIISAQLTRNRILDIKKLKKLYYLAFSGVNFKGEDIVDLTKELRLIRRLAVQGVDISPQEMLLIYQNCGSAITHLGLTIMSAELVDALLKMKSVKVLQNNSNYLDTINTLIKAGVKVNRKLKKKSMFSYF